MKRIEFAELAGISPAMVTKYADQGLIALNADGSVDARASLALLAGRLSEDKRHAALEKLDAVARIAANDSAPAESAASGALRGQRNAKVELDELKRDAQALDLAKKAGEVIPIAHVESVIADAVTELQSAFDVESRAMADQLTIDLNLSPDRTAILQRRLRTLSNRARSRFAIAMGKLGGAESAPPADDDTHAEPADANPAPA